MSVAPNAGVVDLDSFLPSTAGTDGQQGQVPKPLAGQQTYVLTVAGWAPGGGGPGGGTVTSVAATAGTGIAVTGSPITTSGTLNITNTAPDQVVTLAQSGTTTITGTYPNFTISSADQFQGTVTSVTGTSPVASSGGATPAISLSAGYGDTLNPYASKTANFVLAAPNGIAGVPTFRAIVVTDIPTLNQNTTGTADNVTGIVAVANGGTGTTTPAIVAGTNITVSGAWPNQTITASGGSGSVTSVAATAGTGISVTGSPITTSGTLTITNTAPDQTVVLTAGTGINTSGTYPSFTVTNSAPDQTVSLTSGTGISATGTYPNFTINNTGVTSAVAGTGISLSSGTGAVTITNSAPDQTVSLTGAGTTSITGTYPNFTITSNDSTNGTVTSVAATAGTGISITGSPITTSGTLNITNTAPDQTVVLTAGTGINTSGTYPNFTVTNSAPDQTVALANGAGISVTGTYPNFTVTNTSPSLGGTVTSVSGTGTVSGLTLSGTVTGSGNLTLGGAITGFAASGANTDITSVALTSGTITTAPASGTDIVNKAYADAIASGIHFHEAVALATTTTLPANTYNNGASGVGATLTGNANGALSVDSTLTIVAERILVKNEAAGANNGVYVVTQVGSAGTPYILTRATDFDTVGTGVDQIDEGDFFLVTSGVANLNTAWVQQTAPPITVGTTTILFQQFSAPITYSAGTGLSESPSYTFNIANTGTAGTYGSASSVPVFTTNAQGQVTLVTNTTIAIAGSAVSGNITGNAANVTGIVSITSGGTGFATQQDAINALAGAVSSGSYLRGNGTNVVMNTIQVADVPTLNQSTTGSAATLTTGRTISISGDLSYASPTFDGSANVTAAGTLATVNSNVGSFTNASVTVNAKGLITAVSSGSGGGSGTVTSVAALTIGSTGTDLSSTVANGTTTPVITLQVPTASAANRGALSAADWTTFNNKGTVTSVTGTAPIDSSGGNTPAISLQANYGDTQNPYAAKTANFVLAGPASGAALAPTFRALVVNDIPTLNQNTTGTSANVTGIVAVANGGTGTATPTLVAGTNITITGSWPNQTIDASGGGGGVTSVAATVPAFLSITGSPITTSGTLAIGLSGTALPILNGGTGQTTANAALNAFLPSQTSNSGKVLSTNGTDTSWVTAGVGTVTSVNGTGTVSGLTLTGTVTSSGDLTLGGTLNLSSPPAIGFTTPNDGNFGGLTANRLTLNAGTAFVQPIKFNAGPVMSSPVAGSVEYTGINYNGVVSNGVSASRGTLITEHFACRTGSKTLATGTGVQSYLGGGTGGLVTGSLYVRANTTYFFETSILVQNTSATSGNFGWSLTGAGTAVLGTLSWHVFGIDSTAQTTGQSIGGSFNNNPSSSVSVVIASTGTVTSALIKGIFRITTGGTIIPSINLITSATTANVGANTWFKCYPVGTDTVVFQGDWI